MEIKGDLKTVQINELLQFQILEGFYIREANLTNAICLPKTDKPSPKSPTTTTPKPLQDYEDYDYDNEPSPWNHHCNWHHESLTWAALWFESGSGNWMVGDYEPSRLGLLKSSTTPDNRIPEEVNTWEFNIGLHNEKWIMSSDISFKAGTKATKI